MTVIGGGPRLSLGVRWRPDEAAQGTPPPPPEPKPDHRRRPRGEGGKFEAKATTGPTRRGGGRPRKPEAEAEVSPKASWKVKAPPGPTPRQGSCGLQTGGGAARANGSPGVVEKMFERWFAEAKPGDKLAYFRGELAYSKQFDPHLARLCDRLLQLAVGRWDVLSGCGHLRGEIIGSGELMLTSTRVRGEVVHLAIKR